MHDLQALKATLARIKAAEAPSRKIDAEIAELLWPETTRRLPFNGELYTKQHLTGDISAAVALVKHVLPGWAYEIWHGYGASQAVLIPNRDDPAHSARLLAEFPELPNEEDDRLYWIFDEKRLSQDQEALSVCQALLTGMIKIAKWKAET